VSNGSKCFISLVIGHEAQAAGLYLLAPANEGLPGTKAQRGRAEADERDPLVVLFRDVAKDAADEGVEPPGSATRRAHGRISTRRGVLRVSTVASTLLSKRCCYVDFVLAGPRKTDRLRRHCALLPRSKPRT